MFSVVGVSVLYLGGNEAQQQQEAYQNALELNDITVVPSVDNNAIEVEEVPVDGEEVVVDAEVADTDTAVEPTEALPAGDE